MKRNVIHRYEHDADGRILIDVDAERVEDLYNNFDKSAPYVRRDLDQELVDYLIECAREVGPEPFTIRFTLGHPPDDDRASRVRTSVNNFFLYLMDIETKALRRIARRSAVLFLIGVSILFLSVWVNQWLGEDPSVVANVFAEGLIVAAWISLWESLATFMVDWFPHVKDRRLYQRLAAVKPFFRPRPSAAS
jgi:hypothetical protein